MPIGGEIGFATLPEHVHRKSAKKGFDFSIMVVGESGLGKSTLVNCLFLGDLYKDRKIPSVDKLLERTVNIEKKQLDIIEKGIKLRVTIVDTPGFGDSLNTSGSFQIVENYIDEQFNQYFKDESGLNRKNIVDNRIHCCLYFISPFGRGLTQLDIQFMKRLNSKINIVPVIAKADSLTAIEVAQLKKKILRELEENGINIFKIPECDSDEDELYRIKDKEIRESIPFAIIGSTTSIDLNGRRIRGREYPWGIVDIQDERYSDFIKLRTFLSLHMQDLKDSTSDVLYENYRTNYLAQLNGGRIAELDSSGLSADRLLQMKQEEIRRMQEQLMIMQEQLRQTSRPVSNAQSLDDLLDDNDPNGE
ncbi:septin-2-like [Dermatophagoides pteronyssinus]|uniref:Septin-4 n=2 Tax=Dermatophagoides pteronyssinus TaxID=6956 RepID=A0ABQ8JVX7_DERPT|nr:septin-2-like [Dermatophagoides pteronyssinus]KAH9426784.1 Septin-4 [Dermatophagoides pteronyssinus]